LRVSILEETRKSMPDIFDDLATAYARANNLRKDSLGKVVDVSLMGKAEKSLEEAIQKADKLIRGALSSQNFSGTLLALAALREPIDTFFVDVLIMDDDLALRNNRLRLLNRFVSLFENIADFSKMNKASGS
jgi:glycyl-tRNA synthetase beta chain